MPHEVGIFYCLYLKTVELMLDRINFRTLTKTLPINKTLLQLDNIHFFYSQLKPVGADKLLTAIITSSTARAVLQS